MPALALIQLLETCRTSRDTHYSATHYLKRPPVSWGNGSTTQWRTIMPVSHRSSESCPAATMHISALIFKKRKISAYLHGRHESLSSPQSRQNSFSQHVSGKSVKIVSLSAGCRNIYWSFFGGAYITIGGSGFEFKQSPRYGSKWSHKILKAPASRVMMVIIPDDCFLLGEATRQPMIDSFYIMLEVRLLDVRVTHFKMSNRERIRPTLLNVNI